MDSLREATLKGLAANEPHVAQTRDRLYKYTPEEEEALTALRESRAWPNISERELDRNELRWVLSRVTPTPVSVCERLATKIVACRKAGILTEDLQIKEGATITEGMGQSTAGEHGGEDKGMYGVGDGGDAEEPKGAIDSGSDQGADGETTGESPRKNAGDGSKTASKGYMDEQEDCQKCGKEPCECAAECKEDKDSTPDANTDNDQDGDEPGGGIDSVDNVSEMEQEKSENDAEAALGDDNTAATDARYKQGTKQNESSEETDVTEAEPGGSTTENPRGEDPGEGSTGSKGDKGETPDAGTPDYARTQAYGKGVDLDKGPASPVNETELEEIESQVVEMILAAGIEPGTEEFKEKYLEGFALALSERADQVGEAFLTSTTTD